MKCETFAYSADGLRMKGELFLEVGAAPRPWILVFPEAWIEQARIGLRLHGNATLVDDHASRLRRADGRAMGDKRRSRAASIKEIS